MHASEAPSYFQAPGKLQMNLTTRYIMVCRLLWFEDVLSCAILSAATGAVTLNFPKIQNFVCGYGQG